MKRLLIIFLAATLFLPFQQSCDFEPVGDESVRCPDSLNFTFVIKGDTVTFTSDLVYTGNAAELNYSWQFGDSKTSSEPNPWHVYSGPGKYPVSLVVTTNFCLPVSIDTMVTIGTPRPQANFSISPASGIAPLKVTFTNLSKDTTGATYLWDFGGMGTGTSTLHTPPPKTYTKADTFLIKLTVTSASNESDDTTMTLIVRPYTFSNTYDLNTTNEKTAILADELSDGTWGIAVAAQDKTILAKISADGNTVVHSEPAQLPPAFFPTQVPVYGIKTGNGYALGGYTIRTPAWSMFYFVKIKPDFTMEDVKSYWDAEGKNREGHGIALSDNDNGFVLCGNGENSTTAGMQFVKINASYEETNAPIHLTSSPFNTAYVIVETQNGFAAAGRVKNTTGFEACLVLLDKQLANPQVTKLTSQNIEPFDLVLLPGNQGFIMVCLDGSTSKLYKLPLNGGDGTPFGQQYGTTTLYRAIITHDGHLVVVGRDNSGTLLIKINLTNGVEIWRRPLPGKEGRYVTQLSDDGFLIGGTDNNNKALLIRTDSEGNID